MLVVKQRHSTSVLLDEQPERACYLHLMKGFPHKQQQHTHTQQNHGLDASPVGSDGPGVISNTKYSIITTFSKIIGVKGNYINFIVMSSRVAIFHYDYKFQMYYLRVLYGSLRMEYASRTAFRCLRNAESAAAVSIPPVVAWNLGTLPSLVGLLVFSSFNSSGYTSIPPLR